MIISHLLFRSRGQIHTERFAALVAEEEVFLEKHFGIFEICCNLKLGIGNTSWSMNDNDIIFGLQFIILIHDFIGTSCAKSTSTSTSISTKYTIFLIFSILKSLFIIIIIQVLCIVLHWRFLVLIFIFSFVFSIQWRI